jgi:hypothetical protein
LKKCEPRYLTLRGKMPVIGSLVASTLNWHVVKIYPLKAHTDRTRFGNATRIFSFQ